MHFQNIEDYHEESKAKCIRSSSIFQREIAKWNEQLSDMNSLTLNLDLTLLCEFKVRFVGEFALPILKVLGNLKFYFGFFLRNRL